MEGARRRGVFTCYLLLRVSNHVLIDQSEYRSNIPTHSLSRLRLHSGSSTLCNNNSTLFSLPNWTNLIRPGGRSSSSKNIQNMSCQLTEQIYWPVDQSTSPASTHGQHYEVSKASSPHANIDGFRCREKCRNMAVDEEGLALHNYRSISSHTTETSRSTWMYAGPCAAILGPSIAPYIHPSE